MLGRIIAFIGIVLVVYALVTSQPLLAAVSVGLMLAGLLLTLQDRLERQEHDLDDVEETASKGGLGSWRLVDLDHRLKRIEKTAKR